MRKRKEEEEEENNMKTNNGLAKVTSNFLRNRGREGRGLLCTLARSGARVPQEGVA